MNKPTRLAPIRATNPQQLERVELLLGRYPSITENEISEVVAFLRKGPMLDRGLLTSNQSLRAKLAAFEQDQKSTLSLQRSDYAMLLVLGLIVFAIIAFLHN